MKLFQLMGSLAAGAALVGSLAGQPSAPPPPPSAPAATATAWKMDLGNELALWQGPAAAIDLAGFQGRLPLGIRLDLTLQPNGSFPLPVPLRAPPKAGTFGGAPVFVVPQDGVYRIAASAPVRIEVADPESGTGVTSPHFEMQLHSEIRKVVLFPLRAGVPYTLQLSGAEKPEVSVLLTPDAR